MPQEDSCSPTTSRSRCFKEGCRSDEENCKAPVFSNPASGEPSRIRPHKRVPSPGNDIAATNMSYGGENSVATNPDDNDTGEVQVTTTSLNEQLSEITPQPGTDLGSGVFEVDGYTAELQMNIGGKSHHAPISPIAPYGPVVRGKSEDNRQDGQVIGASQPEHLVYIKQLMTPPRNRPPKQLLNSALATTRLNKRKIQEMTQYDSTTDTCKLDEEHGPHRKSQKRVGRAPLNSCRTTGSRSISPDYVGAPKPDAMKTDNVDRFSSTSSPITPPVVLDGTTHELKEKPNENCADASLKQGLILADKGTLVIAEEKARSAPKSNLVAISSPKGSDSAMLEEATGVATINDTPSTFVTVCITATATDDSTFAPHAQSIRSRPSSPKCMIPNEQVSVRAPDFNDAETNRRERPSHDNLEELRNQRYSVFDSPPPDTLGTPPESIFVPALTPRLSDPELLYVEEETALARETAPSPDSFVYSARDDVAGIELACLTQLKSDEDVGKVGHVHYKIPLKSSLRSRTFRATGGTVAHKEGSNYY